jgi:hypothetical protein
LTDGAAISAKQMHASGWNPRRDVGPKLRRRIARNRRQQSVGAHLKVDMAGSTQALDQ